MDTTRDTYPRDTQRGETRRRDTRPRDARPSDRPRRDAEYPPVRRRRRPRRKRYGALAFWMILAFLAGCWVGIQIGRNSPDQADSPRSTESQPPVSTELDTTPEETLWRPSADEAWKLTLVNPWNPIDEDYTITFVQLQSGHTVDKRCYPELQEMMDDCRAAGLSPLICSSYRTVEDQQELYQNKVNEYAAMGYSEAEAEEKAATVVAVPGTSEHHLGLAVDIVDEGYQLLNEAQEETAVQKWLLEHSWEYGFILRYPNEKSDVTGIIYEPWHYRYVGKEAAKAITESGLCLEEYLEEIK